MRQQQGGIKERGGEAKLHFLPQILKVWYQFGIPLSISAAHEDESENAVAATRALKEFEPTTTKHLNIICWQTKPWKDKKPSRLFSSQFAVAWKVDCDEVYPGKKFFSNRGASQLRLISLHRTVHR